jgi:Zn-finger nucleic acid-binding protein
MQPIAPQAPYPPHGGYPQQGGYDPRFDQRGHDQGYRHHKRRKSWLEEIFD